MKSSTITTALARSCFAKRLSILFAAMSVGALLVSAANVHAQSTFTWAGGAGGINWNLGNNWSGSVAPTSGSTSTFVFAGTAKPTNNNNLTNLTMNALLFSTNATAFVLRGNAVTLTGGITNNSANTQTINLTAITNNTTNTINAASNNIVINAAIVGTGGITKAGAGTLILGTNNTYTGATTISGGTLLLSNEGTISTNALDLAASDATLNISNITAATVNVAAFSGVAGSTVSMGAKNMSFGGNNASTTFAGVVTGSGNLTKNGTGTTTLSGANTYTGSAIVSAGTLQLNNATGSALGSITNLSVATNSVLLVSQSNQVNDASAVSLSGGTIRTPAGISETFGNLSVTGSGTLDFGATFGNASSMNFGTYTPSALLTLNNFNFGSTLTFKTDLTSSITNSSLFAFSNGGISSFNWNAGTSTFTITAIPEPSTVLAAAGLVGLMLWPSRRRIIRDAKKILGLRAPMRDRLAAQRAR